MLPVTLRLMDYIICYNIIIIDYLLRELLSTLVCLIEGAALSDFFCLRHSINSLTYLLT